MKSPNKNPMQYISIGLELVMTVLVCVGMGYFADQYLQSKTPWFTLVGAVLGLGVGLYQFIKRTL